MTVQVAAPTSDDLALLIGRPADVEWGNGVGGMCVSVATELAAAYCRNVGFSDDLSMVPQSVYPVILLRAVRICQNYSQLIAESADGVSMTYGAAAQDFTMGEKLILDGYRRTAA